MRIKFDFRGVGWALLGGTVVSVAFVGLSWLFVKWFGFVGIGLSLLLFVLILLTLKFERKERKDLEERFQADDLDALDRDIVSVGIKHPEYTDAKIQAALNVSASGETIRKRRDVLYFEKGYPVHNEESLKRKKPKE